MGVPAPTSWTHKRDIPRSLIGPSGPCLQTYVEEEFQNKYQEKSFVCYSTLLVWQSSMKRGAKWEHRAVFVRKEKRGGVEGRIRALESSDLWRKREIWQWRVNSKSSALAYLLPEQFNRVACEARPFSKDCTDKSGLVKFTKKWEKEATANSVSKRYQIRQETLL